MSDIYYAVAHRDQSEIDSFKTRYDMFDTTVIPDIFRKTLNLTVTDITKSSSWGTSHVIYFVTIEEQKNILVFRANLGFNTKPEFVMKVEKLICEKVRALHVPTNTILAVDISRSVYPFDYQIEECLEGSDIESSFKGTMDVYDSLSFRLGTYIATYSSIQFEKFGMFDEQSVQGDILRGTKPTFYDYMTTCLYDDISYLVDNRVITKYTGERIVQLFEEHKPIINDMKKGSLVHHDLADHNIFIKGYEITGIFDWEAAVIGDPVLDLASCPTWRTYYPREEKLVEGYQSLAQLPNHFTEKMNIYRLRTMLWKIVFAIRMNILNDTRKGNFLRALEPFKL